MNNYHRNGSGNWNGNKKKYNGGQKYGGGYGGERNTSMHEATCSRCDAICEVPFKPNGRKPVLCSFCFRKPKEEERYQGTPRDNSDEVSKQLRALNEKMDQIIDVLMSLGEEEDEDEDAM